MNNILSSSIDNDKIFIVQFSELQGRIDPIFYVSDLNKFNAGIYDSVCLKSVIRDIKSGIGAGKQDQSNATDGIIQIRPTNIDEDGFLKYDKNVFIPKSDANMKLDVDDVLFNNTNSQELVGKTAILKEQRELSCSNHITKIKVYKNIIIPDYLWIILNIYQKNRIFYSICTNWNNQSGIGIDLLKTIKIPLPPIAIQQKIVNIHQIAHQQKQQKEVQAQALLAGIDNYLLEELGIKMPVENGTNDMSSYQDVELNKQNPLVKNGRLFLTGFREIAGGRLDPINSRYLGKKSQSTIFENISLGEIAVIGKGQSITSREIIKGEYPVIAGGQSSPYSHNKYNNDTNVITVSASGAYAGFVWYHNYPIFASDCVVIRSKDENLFSTKYIFEVLKTKQKEIYLFQQGAGQPHVYPADLTKVLIPVVPIDIQEKLIRYINSLRNRAQLLQEEALQTLQKTKAEIEKMILG